MIHLAAQAIVKVANQDPAGALDTNVRGTLNVVQAARDLGIDKVVHTSTSEVYGDPLEHPQVDLVAIKHRHETHVAAAREACVILDQRAESRDGRGRGIGHQQNGMRVAHRHGAYLDRLRTDLQGVGDRLCRGVEWNLCGGEIRRAHVNPHLVVTLQVQADRSGRGADRDLAVARQPPVIHETGKAARAIAALFDLAAIGIEDAVVELCIGVARSFDQQYLVAADTEPPVGEGAQLGFVEHHLLTGRVEHDEIVAQAMHFGEIQDHTVPSSGGPCRAYESRVKESPAPLGVGR